MQVSTRWRSTVKRCTTDACGSSRTRSHSGRIRSSAPVSSRVSQTPSRPGPAARSRTNRSRASTGHGSGNGGESRTSRAAVGGARTRSRSAASLAARRSSSGSSAGLAPRSRTTSSKEIATPGATVSSLGRRPPTELGCRCTASARRHASRERWVRRRARPRVWTCAVVPSGRSSRWAISSQYSGTTRSVARPATACRASRTSSRAIRHRSRSTWGTSTSQLATSALSTVASRSPPMDSLRSGTEACASSPVIRPRSETSSCSSPRRVRASRRHWLSTADRSRSVRLGSPARWRASSMPVATRRSAAAWSSTSSTVRTEWSTLAPESQRGYQIWPAQSPSSTSGSWTSTTSRSLKGASSWRP